MAITIEIFEDSGALSAGRGTITQEVDNIGWKDSDLDETYEFHQYPIRRPYSTGTYATYSYKKYNFFKLSGTYTSAEDFLIGMIGSDGGAPGTGTATKFGILYKWTDTYATPDNAPLDGTLVDLNNLPTWNALYLSTTGPNGTFNEVPSLATDTTYYTKFLVTQLVVYKSSWDDYGNIDPSINIAAAIKENKTGLPGYDEDELIWTP